MEDLVVRGSTDPAGMYGVGGMHENHLYLAMPFLMIAGGMERTLRPLAWAVSVMAAINLYVFYGLGEGWPPMVGRRWTGIDLTVWLAAINVGIFVWATNELRRAEARLKP